MVQTTMTVVLVVVLDTVQVDLVDHVCHHPGEVVCHPLEWMDHQARMDLDMDHHMDHLMGHLGLMDHQVVQATSEGHHLPICNDRCILGAMVARHHLDHHQTWVHHLGMLHQGVHHLI